MNPTIVLFTSDHGDMLGERGLWFKKHFYEHAMRVPLFIRAPWLKARRIPYPVSLVDLLPTMNAIAGGDPIDDGSTDGTDLLSLPPGGNDGTSRGVYAEYLAEAAIEPMFMIRRGPYKYIHAPQDGNLLFDLDEDPRELQNLYDDTAHSDLARMFDEEARQKWDAPPLDRAIRSSQQRRLLVRAAHSRGEPVRWNHGELPGEPVPWYRGETGYSEWAFRYLPIRD